jgi:hypothetical protein
MQNMTKNTEMTFLIDTLKKTQIHKLRSSCTFLGILLLILFVCMSRSGLASELGNVQAQAHFTAYGWQPTAMQIEGSYTDRTWKELHLAQLRRHQQIVIRFQNVKPATLIVRHSGTYYQGRSQTLINVSVNGYPLDQGYQVPGHRDPGTAPAESAMPPLKSWQVSKWLRPGENTITISVHPKASSVYWLKDVWLTSPQGIDKGLAVVAPKDKTKHKNILQWYQGSHALLIGVSHYSAGWPDLLSVPSEIEILSQALHSSGFKVVRVLDPTADKLRKAFTDFIGRNGYAENNRLLFFFSGHGYSRKRGTKGYLVPTDAPDPRINETAFLRKALSMGQIITWAKEIEAKHALFVFDSCFSGTVFKSKALPQIPPHISEITARPVRQFITAGDAGEEVPAKSVFLPSIVRALQGEADVTGDGYVTGTELGMFLHDRVISYHTGQTPQYGKIRDPDLDQGDFVFSVSGRSEMVLGE